MREAIGNTFIVNLLLVFIGVMSALLVGSVSYSKAFKVKNRIIYTIEKYGGWDVKTSGGRNVVQAEIEASLKDIGYPLVVANGTIFGSGCPERKGAKLVYGGHKGTGSAANTYHYCVYEYSGAREHYYGVTTFMHFDIPLIGNYLEFPVNGKTKPLFNIYNESIYNN